MQTGNQGWKGVPTGVGGVCRRSHPREGGSDHRGGGRVGGWPAAALGQQERNLDC
jgi:hypothetical protein